MTARVLLLALAQVAVVWAVGLATVALVRRRMGWAGESTVAGALLALPGFVLVAVGLMAAHAVSGGRVFSNAFVVPLVLVVLFIAARRGLRAFVGFDSAPGAAARRWVLVGLGLVLVLVYMGPALLAGSSVRSGDPPWHLGWSEQILGGQPVPVGPAPEFARNAYPWGYHAVLATMVRAVPSSDPLVAHEAMHLVLIFALPLAAAALARVVDRRAALPAAAAMSLVGGWGWIEARAPAFFPRPRYAFQGADLAVGSPNAVYELFPPAMPRELGLVLLAAAGLLIARSIGSRSSAAFALAGAAVGLAGLVSLPMFVAGLAWIGASLWWARGIRVRAAAWMFGAAGAVMALWAAPMAWNFLAHGGFVRVSPRLGREWPLATALGSWGLLGPAALLGAVLVARRSGAARAIFAFVVATSGFLLLTVARGTFDWDLAGQATLFHQGRVWPVAHLLGAVLAGVAVVWIWERGRRGRVRRGATAALLGVLAAVAVTSPVLASAQLTRFMGEHRFGFVYSDPQIFEPTSFLRRAAAHMGPDDIALVEGSDDLAFFLFQFSGVRLARYDDPHLEGNDLRIRYRDLADAWDERMQAGGFGPPDLVVQPASGHPPPGLGMLERGRFRGEIWTLYGRRG